MATVTFPRPRTVPSPTPSWGAAAEGFRRARAREALRIGALAAAACRRAGERDRTDRYHTLVPRPGVRVILCVASAALMAVAGCAWLAPGGDATVAAMPLRGWSRLGVWLRLLAVELVVDLAVVAALDRAGGLFALGVAGAAMAGALAWLLGLRRRGRSGVIRRARADIVAHTDGPVVEASCFAARSAGAGLRLARELCALADAGGVTVVAEADGAARARLYRRLGFEVAAVGPEPWTPILVVRRPAGSVNTRPLPPAGGGATVAPGPSRAARPGSLRSSAPPSPAALPPGAVLPPSTSRMGRRPR